MRILNTLIKFHLSFPLYSSPIFSQLFHLLCFFDISFKNYTTLPKPTKLTLLILIWHYGVSISHTTSFTLPTSYYITYFPFVQYFNSHTSFQTLIQLFQLFLYLHNTLRSITKPPILSLSFTSSNPNSKAF